MLHSWSGTGPWATQTHPCDNAVRLAFLCVIITVIMFLWDVQMNLCKLVNNKQGHAVFCKLIHHKQLGAPEMHCMTLQATREEFAYHKGISRLERGFQA